MPSTSPKRAERVYGFNRTIVELCPRAEVLRGSEIPLPAELTPDTDFPKKVLALLQEEFGEAAEGLCIGQGRERTFPAGHYSRIVNSDGKPAWVVSGSKDDGNVTIGYQVGVEILGANHRLEGQPPRWVKEFGRFKIA